MKKLIKKTENRFDTVGAFVGNICHNCSSCSCTSEKMMEATRNTNSYSRSAA